jgi:2-polyprenyl-3-methyl-5-hydroxy-6-metoxy-1,4-benzoquinol methylase
MDIFEATLNLKKYTYKGNNQLININDKIEISGFSALPFLCYYNKLNDINDYDNLTTSYKLNYIFDKDVFHYRRILNNHEFININELSANNINTKEYWNFLHEEFQYCDVSSYYKVNDLNTYFAVKGPHYDGIINSVGVKSFKNKKILEIGPGYGYLNKTLTEQSIPHKYYCADIVKRFSHDNFIDINGYDLNNITEKFDLVIMQDVIGHLGQKILKQYLKNIKLLLNDNGKLYIVTEMTETRDHASLFFGQTYHNLGYNNLENYLNEIGFNVNYNSFSITEQHKAYILEITLKNN